MNHHIIDEPYLHIMYTVLKYNLLNHRLYLDIFISCTQYIASYVSRKPYFIPKFYDEDLSGILPTKANEKIKLMEEYEKMIYNMVYNDLNNIYLLIEKINIITSINLNFIISEDDILKIKIQKNIIQYLNNIKVLNDNKIKKELCTVKDDNITFNYLNKIYKFIIDQSLILIKEQGILNKKNIL